MNPESDKEEISIDTLTDVFTPEQVSYLIELHKNSNATKLRGIKQEWSDVVASEREYLKSSGGMKFIDRATRKEAFNSPGDNLVGKLKILLEENPYTADSLSYFNPIEDIKLAGRRIRGGKYLKGIQPFETKLRELSEKSDKLKEEGFTSVEDFDAMKTLSRVMSSMKEGVSLEEALATYKRDKIHGTVHLMRGEERERITETLGANLDEQIGRIREVVTSWLADPEATIQSITIPGEEAASAQ